MVRTVDPIAPRPRPRHILAATVVLCAWLALATASACTAALAATLSDVDPMGIPTGLDAAVALAEAVQRAEPALPVLVRTRPEVDNLPESQAEAVAYLADRQLLSRDWRPETLTQEAWNHALTTWTSWYGLPPPNAAVPSTRAGLVATVGQVTKRVTAHLRPALLFATGDADRAVLGFRGLILNWSIYPRLVVFPPLEAGTSPVRAQEVVATVESCAIDVRHWLSLSVHTARRLFLEQRPPRMVVVATEPAKPDLTPWWVPVGEELDVLTYEHLAVRELDAFSVVFAGPPLPFSAWLRLLPNVRTNASPVDLRRYLQTPPSVGDR